LSTLQRLIAPYPATNFASEIWDRTHLCVPRHDRHYFDWLFTVRDLDTLFCRDNLRFPAIQLFLNGAQLEAHQFTRTWDYGQASYRDFIDMDRVYALFDKGGTINIVGLERLWAPVAAMNRGLEFDSGFPVHTTAFLTPRSADNIPPHYDMVDVFILQISGTKRWRLWPSDTGLPLVEDKFRFYPAGHPAVADACIIDEFELKSGDTLFVPRGMIHQAITTDSHSLHITVGINPHRRWDAVQIMVENALRELAREPEARRALSPNCRLGDHAAQAVDRRRAAKLIDLLAREVEVQRNEAISALDFGIISSRNPARPGQLVERAHVDPSTVVRRRAGLLSRMSMQGERWKLEFQSKSLNLGPSLGSLVDAIEAMNTFCATDLPGTLPIVEKCAFVERLLQEGYLEIPPSEHRQPPDSLASSGSAHRTKCTAD
jgi:Cupin superfamily protein